MSNYKDTLYKYYRSSFKGRVDASAMEMSVAKLMPVVGPWVAERDKDELVVDLGCGAGELLLTLKRLGFKNLTGCDLSAEQVLVAQTLFPTVKEQNLFAFLESYADGEIGIITLFDVLEHLTRQQALDLLVIVRRKLKPNGRFIVHMPNGLSPFVGHVYWGDITHEWCLTPQSAEVLCRVSGLTNFECVEHLGESAGFKGNMRKVAWRLARGFLRVLNRIETGSAGGMVWTRNFAFKADKQMDFNA